MHESARPGIHGAESPDWTHDAFPPAQPADEPTEPYPFLPARAADEPIGDQPAADLGEDGERSPAADEVPAVEAARQSPPEGTAGRAESGGVVAGDPADPVGGSPLADVLDEPTAELPVLTSRPDPRRWTARLAVAVVALALMAGAVVAIGRGDRPVPSAGTAAPAGRWGTGTPEQAQGAGTPEQAQGTGTPEQAQGAATAPLDGRTTAGLDLVDAATAIRLRTADLGGDLYRVSTPADSGVLPRISDDGARVRLALDRAAGGGPAELEVALSARVRWDLRVAGGTSLSVLDLREGRLGTVDLAGGASQIDLTLPRPDGTLTVRMTGGVSRFDVHTAARVPMRVRVGAGAGQVVLAGRAHDRVAAGALFTVDGWDDAVDRIDVDAVAGVSALTVAPYAAA